MSAKRVRWLGLVLLGVAFLAGQAPAATINVSATVNGNPNTVIGTLNSNIDNSADNAPTGGTAGKMMSSVFQLNDPNKNLMNDVMGCQFRYVQIITAYNGAPVNRADGTALPVPWVDFPLGGYQGFGGAEDNAPFYENDDGTGPFPNYPRYSDPFPTNPYTSKVGFNNEPVHDQGIGDVLAIDVPRQPNGVSVTFETYIVYVNNQMRAQAPAMFQVLAGFRWQASFAANGATFTELTGNGGINDITAGNADGAAITRINTALGNSGFNGQFAWQATSQGKLEPCVPEPSSLALLAIGGGVTVWFRRRTVAKAKCA